MSPRCFRVAVYVIFCICFSGFGDIRGTLRDTSDRPIPGAFISALTQDRTMDGYAVTEPDGTFTITSDRAIRFLAVQPAAVAAKEDIEGYAYQPRLFALKEAPENLVLRLPPASCLVVRAYRQDGSLMRWEDFETRATFGGVFLYVTDLNDEAAEAVCWPVHDKTSRVTGSSWKTGLPALAVRPGKTYVVQALFWDVPGYGNVLVRADNAGKGFRVEKAGDFVILDFEVELARTAVADLKRRSEIIPHASVLDELDQRLSVVLSKKSPADRAVAANALLGDALRLRDKLEVEAARRRILSVRKGKLKVTVRDKSGVPVSGKRIDLHLRRPRFQFGVFEGSPFNSAAYKAAHEAGFSLATVLPAWGWTDESAGANWPAINRVLGISALRQMGFAVKAHGVLWLQEYGILPETKRNLSPDLFVKAAQRHVKTLLDVWGDQIDLWEVMNEPATVNIIGLPREDVFNLVRDVGRLVKETTQKPTLINSPHEFDYGRKYQCFSLDGEPTEDYPLTYSAFLRMLRDRGTMDLVDIIGLQFYSGPRLNAALGGHIAPAFSLGWFVDTVERYRQFGKPLHITEMSVPSSPGDRSDIAYWREPWTLQTQADYTEAVFTLAFGTPAIESITYWDITDAKPSVIQGGLTYPDVSPKPVFERLRDRIHEWMKNEEMVTNQEGIAEAEILAGDYEMTVGLSNGKKVHATATVTPHATVEVFLGET